ncbi:hypothetical protein GCM10007036_03760 [Alsobacter metallidurans]|uniref:Uncharacterized protein n=1 Tax=Alsobacter metallidurans TaxID=340221 RepID=A0A917I391_9HYPH|nr:hypothetical protein [Alsobacter metallidurans]GGH08327.1 hypothetical protein GCM10007036_03760 [Alsobacter metallidurans]
MNTNAGRKLPPLMKRHPVLRLVLEHAAVGALLGLVFAVALLAFDAHGLRRLIAESDSGYVAFAMLAVGFMVTFGSLVAGGAIMSLPKGDDDGPGGGRRYRLQPIPVRARSSRRSSSIQRDWH